MPTYEYKCEPCEVAFEELLLRQDDVKQYSDHHPCPNCGQDAQRNYVTAFGFAFKGEVRGKSGVHGNSGVHDLDYPTLDKAVARSSEKRWEIQRERVAEIEKVRNDSGNRAVTLDETGSFRPMDNGHAEKRTEMLKKAYSPE